MKIKNSRNAFTQIELIFVIIIIAILGATAIQSLSATRDDAKLSSDISNMGQCINEVASRYVASGYDMTTGDSMSCDAVKCYNITYATNGSNFIVAPNPSAESYCSDIVTVGGHLVRTYTFAGTSVRYQH